MQTKIDLNVLNFQIIDRYYRLRLTLDMIKIIVLGCWKLQNCLEVINTEQNLKISMRYGDSFLFFIEKETGKALQVPVEEVIYKKDSRGYFIGRQKALDFYREYSLDSGIKIYNIEQLNQITCQRFLQRCEHNNIVYVDNWNDEELPPDYNPYARPLKRKKENPKDFFKNLKVETSNQEETRATNSFSFLLKTRKKENHNDFFNNIKIIE